MWNPMGHVSPEVVAEVAFIHGALQYKNHRNVMLMASKCVLSLFLKLSNR